MNKRLPDDPRTIVLHLIGPTCAGKSSIIAEAVSLSPDRVRAVEVGKKMREKYPPEHFAGQAAPEHTQAEAWEWYIDGVRQAIRDGVPLVLVDGQPRDIRQARDIATADWRDAVRFLMVHAKEESRRQRAVQTRSGDSLELALARLSNDYRNAYVVNAEIMRAMAVGFLPEGCLDFVDTDEHSAVSIARDLLRRWAG